MFGHCVKNVLVPEVVSAECRSDFPPLVETVGRPLESRLQRGQFAPNEFVEPYLRGFKLGETSFDGLPLGYRRETPIVLQVHFLKDAHAKAVVVQETDKGYHVWSVDVCKVVKCRIHVLVSNNVANLSFDFW